MKYEVNCVFLQFINSLEGLGVFFFCSSNPQASQVCCDIYEQETDSKPRAIRGWEKHPRMVSLRTDQADGKVCH